MNLLPDTITSGRGIEANSTCAGCLLNNNLTTETNVFRKTQTIFYDRHVESPTLKFLFADTTDDALCRWNRDHLPHRERLAP